MSIIRPNRSKRMGRPGLGPLTSWFTLIDAAECAGRKAERPSMRLSLMDALAALAESRGTDFRGLLGWIVDQYGVHADLIPQEMHEVVEMLADQCGVIDEDGDVGHGPRVYVTPRGIEILDDEGDVGDPDEEDDDPS